MVYYRKYRPQKINELDNSSVRASLQAIFRNENSSGVPHAFLFTGPKGLGKTSSARIVAKAANCLMDSAARENGFEPCDTCESCISIINGTNLDVLEIDAASNRGIDEIRDLKEKIRLAPLSAKKKVYIIDEVHMLTTEAFNALLKTLEEPPAHALFILCTTESHKLPETIISRCFQVSFSHATPTEIVRSLHRVVDGEKLAIQAVALESIASVVTRMNGGFRDATKMLEEIVLLAEGKEITKDWLDQHFPATNVFLHVVSMLEALQKRDMKLALGIVSAVTAQGIEIRFFLSELLLELHKELLRLLGLETASFSAEHLRFSVSDVKKMSELFSKAYQDMKYAVLPQIPLELAIVESCLSVFSSSTETQKPEKPEEKESMTGAIKGVSVDSLRKQVGMINKHKALYGEDKTPSHLAEKKQTVEDGSLNLMNVPGEGEMTKEWLNALWRGIIFEMKQYNHTVAGVLRSCTIDGYTERNLVIATAYAFHKERLDDVKTKTALIKVCKILTGKDVDVTVELKK